MRSSTKRSRSSTTHWRSPTNSSPRAFAEAPNAFLPQPPGAVVVDGERFHLSVSADGRFASVCRLRATDAASVFAEVVAAAPNARITWTFADAALDAPLRELGCRDVDPPLTSYVTALATSTEPPAADDVEVRRVESYDEFLAALDVSATGWGTAPYEDPEEMWQRHSSRPGGDWVAYVDGQPAAYAGAIAGEQGLFLTGGVTLPEARGRGAYRALVHTRWDEAVRLGTPALVVHAEDASRRVLEHIGFTYVCDIVELVSEPS